MDKNVINMLKEGGFSESVQKSLEVLGIKTLSDFEFLEKDDMQDVLKSNSRIENRILVQRLKKAALHSTPRHVDLRG